MSVTELFNQAAGQKRVDRITIRRPDDFHVHLRDGAMLQAVLPFTAAQFARGIIMRTWYRRSHRSPQRAPIASAFSKRVRWVRISPP